MEGFPPTREDPLEFGGPQRSQAFAVVVVPVNPEDGHYGAPVAVLGPIHSRSKASEVARDRNHHADHEHAVVWPMIPVDP